jgi:hypothetical protein
MALRLYWKIKQKKKLEVPCYIMKKITLLLIAAAICSLSFGQAQYSSKSNAQSGIESSSVSQVKKTAKFANKSAVTPVYQTPTRPQRNVASVVLNETFDAGIPAGWQNVDVDADGNAWFAYTSNTQHPAAVASASWATNALTPNNWLITSAITLPSESLELSWAVTGQDPSWFGEHYKVMVSTSSAQSSFTTVLFEETLPSAGWKTRSVDLSAYAGQTVYVAFVHYNITDMFYIVLDDVKVQTPEPPETVDCNWTIEMTDDYGDGWANASVDVYKNGTYKDSYIHWQLAILT